jgi:hypothetical protein
VVSYKITKRNTGNARHNVIFFQTRRPSHAPERKISLKTGNLNHRPTRDAPLSLYYQMSPPLPFRINIGHMPADIVMNIISCAALHDKSFVLSHPIAAYGHP